MKNKYILSFLLLLFVFCTVNQVSAQQRLSTWVASLEETETGSGGEVSNKKRIAFIFTQTVHWDPNKGKIVPEDNFSFRQGNAVQICAALENFGKFDSIGCLCGEQLTKSNVLKIFQLMADKTKPGDEIFIYWESHGGTGEKNILRDESGEELDGYHEFLILGSGPILHPEAIIIDDEFANMLKILNDRNVMILMEACHSGGIMAQQNRNKKISIKSLNSYLNNNNASNIDYASLTPLLSRVMAHPAEINSYNRNGNRTKQTPHFFKRVFESATKDIQSDHPNLSVIFSTGENSSSYCPLLTTDNKFVVYDMENHVWKAVSGEVLARNSNYYPIGAPTFALILAMSDRSGDYSDEEYTLFEDVWKIAKDLIPVNSERLDAMYNENVQQKPQYLNTNQNIELRPRD